MRNYPPEVESELVLYLKLMMLEFGHEPLNHEDMLAFDKRFLGISIIDTLPDGSIPDVTCQSRLIDLQDDPIPPWVITEEGYQLVKKYDRKQSRLK